VLMQVLKYPRNARGPRSYVILAFPLLFARRLGGVLVLVLHLLQHDLRVPDPPPYEMGLD
jgi:hypothetical protein